MSLSALAIALAIPPVNLVAICIAGAILSRWRRGFGLIMLAVGLTVLWLLSLPLVAGLLLASLERHLPLSPATGDPPLAIVILSAEMQHGADSTGWGPGPLTLERERVGAALFRHTGLPILVTGGAFEDDRETLANVMARSLAEDFDVPTRWTEPTAKDTWENATRSAAILRGESIHSIYLVTHGWHMRRALIAFERAGVTVTAAPVRIEGAPTGAWTDLVPRASAWLNSYYALHEWLGCLDYAYAR